MNKGKIEVCHWQKTHSSPWGGGGGGVEEETRILEGKNDENWAF